MGRFIDLTGQRFGRLVVLNRAEDKCTSGGNKKVMWHCKCDCGNDVYISSGSLRSNHSKSCGCYKKDLTVARNKTEHRKHNKYEILEDTIILYDSNNNEIYIDVEDFELISKYCWSIHHTGYVYAKSNNKHIALHKLVMDDLSNNYTIDHKNGIKHDCRKSNLRKCTRSQNNTNKVLQKNNTSGVSGVHWSKKEGKWIVSINPEKGIRKEIYRTTDFDEAVKQRRIAEEKYYKDFSYYNSRIKEK